MVPIIRRIDELGRIVIPKDIRKELRIINNDLIEIKVENNKIILSKNKENNDYLRMCNRIIENIYKITKNNIIITNTDIVLCHKDNYKYKLKKEKINQNIVNKILNRSKLNEYGILSITNNIKIEKYYLFEPIIINSNSVGSIIYFKDEIISKEEIKLIELSRLLLESYIEE